MDKDELLKLNQIPSNVITDKDNNMLATMFQANFDIVMLNGSSLHTHNIINFTLSQISSDNDKNHVVNGTATINMKDGPVNDVPLRIKVLDNIIQYHHRPGFSQGRNNIKNPYHPACFSLASPGARWK